MIRGLQTPSNNTELRYFLRLCNIFRWFGPSFAWIAAPLNRKLRKDQRHVYTELSNEELETLETLKEMLASLPVLALPRLQVTYTVDTDTCDR